jgi:hypothetical protein
MTLKVFLGKHGCGVERTFRIVNGILCDKWL